MTREEFFKEVQRINPDATEAKVFGMVGDSPLSSNLARHIAETIRDTAIAPTHTSAPSIPTSAKPSTAIAKAKAAKGKSKLQQRQEDNAETVAAVKGMFQTQVNQSIGTIAEFLQAATGQADLIDDLAAERLAAIVSPELRMQNIMLKAAVKVADASAPIEGVNLFGDALDVIGSVQGEDPGLKSIQDYIDECNSNFVNNLRAIAPQA